MDVLGTLVEFLVLALCIAAVVTNSLMLTACDLVDVESFLFEGSLGLFQWQVPGQHNECIDIAESSSDLESLEDQSLKCARYAAAVACGFGVILTIVVFFQQFIVPLPRSQLWMDCSAVSVQICLGLVYILWYSKICTDFECARGDGFLFVFLTQGLSFLAGALTRCMRPGRWDRRDEIQAAREKRLEEKAARAEAQRQEQEENEAAVEIEGMDAPSRAPSETSSMQVGISVNPEDQPQYEQQLQTNHEEV